jgi:hypothetical protein
VNPSAGAERRVVCENCGEIVEFEPVGGPGDSHPELSYADRLIPADECPICEGEE